MRRHTEKHSLAAIGWLRASVLGANDGIVSTASLILGVAAAQATYQSIVVTGIAGLVAGTMAMATGEYVSVHSQADSEKAAISQEKAELAADFQGEHRELTAIYMHRGLGQTLAAQVADQLMAHDALAAHAHDELGITSTLAAKPLEAAVASGLSFAVGAALPLSMSIAAPQGQAILWVALSALVCLAILGGVAAKVGNASILTGAFRVLLWSSLAMGATAAVGRLVGAAV